MITSRLYSCFAPNIGHLLSNFFMKHFFFLIPTLNPFICWISMQFDFLIKEIIILYQQYFTNTNFPMLQVLKLSDVSEKTINITIYQKKFCYAGYKTHYLQITCPPFLSIKLVGNKINFRSMQQNF